jgi:hypothetical protein
VSATPSGIYGALLPSRVLFTQSDIAAAVETTTGIGGKIPTAIVTSRSSSGGGGVSSYVFTGASTMRILWQLNGYVQQDASANGTQSVFFSPPTFASSGATLNFANGNLTTRCLPWARVESLGAQFLMSNTTYTCAQPDESGSCTVASVTSLPNSVLTSMSVTDLTSRPNWVHYYMTVTCDVTSDTPFSNLDMIELPLSTLQIRYGLQNRSGDMKTDTVTPPFFDFLETGITISGVSTSTVDFSIQSNISTVPENIIGTALTITSLFDSQLSDTEGGIPYGSAFAFGVELKVRVLISHFHSRFVG